MKKILASLLAVSLLASLSVPALAATNEGGDTSITVNGTYQAADAPADTISVDIKWDDMSFTYQEGSKGDWNPESHEYENGTAGRWDATSGTDPEITITNHSNIDVNADFAFNSMVSNLSGVFWNENLVLDSAEGTEVANAPKASTKFWVSGSNAAIDANTQLGTVVVTISRFDTTPQMLSTPQDFYDTQDKSGVFVLENDIDLGDGGMSSYSAKYVLDLNGHTLSTSNDDWLLDLGGGRVIIKNGTIKNTGFENGTAIKTSRVNLDLKNCTLISEGRSLFVMNAGTTRVISSKLDGWLLASVDHAVEFSSVGLADKEKISLQNRSTLTVLPGTYNFDPTAYVDTDTYDVAVTADGTTWIVTKK